MAFGMGWVLGSWAARIAYFRVAVFNRIVGVVRPDSMLVGSAGEVLKAPRIFLHAMLCRGCSKLLA